MNVEDGPFKVVPVMVSLYDTVNCAPHFILNTSMSPIKMEFIRVSIITITHKSMSTKIIIH